MKTSGLDVHKDSIFCAIYDGKSYSIVKEFSTTTLSIRSLGQYLKSEDVKNVAMESTSTYWVPIWDILYEMGFDLKLINPLHIKQMPGRKSDAKDAQWIAELLYKNMLRGSLVPPPLVQELRTYTREYRNLVNQSTKVLTKMDRILVMSGIRLSSCISNIDSKSFIQVVEALIRGETDPEKLVKLVYGNCENKKSGKLCECLTGNMKAYHQIKLMTCKQQFDLFEKQISLYLSEMQKLCDEHFCEEINNLTTLPGLSKISAMIIIAETGGDMSVFENSGKFTGWTGLRPRNDESAGKFKSTATTKGNKHLRAIIVQVGWAATRTKESYFMDKFQKLAMRKSRKKALIAIGRKMLVIIWHILSEKTQYNPNLIRIYDPVKVEHKIKYHEREIERAKKLIY
ncbi:MAG TPA: IS110 family transposase [Candidatus Paceibacterota bacterium]|nr:IS110 family transposase [Candidatus Paceibacterota bacterium]